MFVFLLFLQLIINYMEIKELHHIGNCLISHNGNIFDNKIYNFKMDTERILKKMDEMSTSLNGIMQSTNKLTDAILTRSRADENNSIANINLSKALLEDKEIIKRLLTVLENNNK